MLFLKIIKQYFELIYVKYNKFLFFLLFTPNDLLKNYIFIKFQEGIFNSIRSDSPAIENFFSKIKKYLTGLGDSHVLICFKYSFFTRHQRGFGIRHRRFLKRLFKRETQQFKISCMYFTWRSGYLMASLKLKSTLKQASSLLNVIFVLECLLIINDTFV